MLMMSSYPTVKPRSAPARFFTLLLSALLFNATADAADLATSDASKSAPATTAPSQFDNPIIKSKESTLLVTYEHWAGISPYTSHERLAET